MSVWSYSQKIMILVRSVVPYMCIRSPISLTSLTSSERIRCLNQYRMTNKILLQCQVKSLWHDRDVIVTRYRCGVKWYDRDVIMPIEDCLDGIDEKQVWPTCGSGRTLRYTRDSRNCQNVFLCTTTCVRIPDIRAEIERRGHGTQKTI